MQHQRARIVRCGVIAACGLCMLTGTVGCGGETSSNVIRVTRNIGGREGFRIHFEKWQAAFENAHPGWVMELTDLGNADGAQFYKTRIATGDLPEVIMTWELTNFLADGGNLVPLPDSYYEKFGIPLPTPYKGKRYTSQAGLQIQGVAVNKAMWEDIGVTDPPETWEAWFAAFHKLKEKGYKPLVLGGREWSAAQPLFYAISSDMYDRTVEPATASWTKRRDAGEVRFATDPIARQALETMFDLVENFVDKGAGSDGYNEEQRDFYGGKGAAWFMGCWMAGDLEPNRVDFKMEYWPVPSMVGRPRVFIRTSGMPSGWAITTSATGEKRDKAMAVMEAFYDPEVYQALLNGECQFGEATKVPATMPQYGWAPAQRLIENMRRNLAKYGTTRGFHIALDDMPPPGFHDMMARVMQEIMAGTRDIDKLLKILDDEWDSARKGM